MEEMERFFVSALLHKAFIAMNEKATEATAATAIPFGAACPGEVLLDRPFVFPIRDLRTGTILSPSRVVNPGSMHRFPGGVRRCRGGILAYPAFSCASIA